MREGQERDTGERHRRERDRRETQERGTGERDRDRDRGERDRRKVSYHLSPVPSNHQDLSKRLCIEERTLSSI
jgi:hypothetical protein